jgi:hypothetical protein
MRVPTVFVLSAVLLALAPITAGAQGAMRFSWGTNGGNCGQPCVWIAAEGEIVADTPAEFQRFINFGLQPGALVFLNSPGGSVTAAMELGRQLRRNSALVAVGKNERDPLSRTYQRIVPGGCLSACVFAFMGGAQRFYDDGSKDLPRPWWGEWWPGQQRLGVHQFYIGQAAHALESRLGPGVEFSVGMSMSQVITGVLVAYAIEMEVDPRVVTTLAAGASPGDMRSLSWREAVDLRLSNASDPLPNWSLRPYRGGLAALSEGSVDVRHFEARITCRPERAEALELVASTRVDFGVSNVTDPQGALRAGLRPIWRVVQGGDPVDIDAPLDGTWHKNGITTVAVTIGPVALDALKRGKQLIFLSRMPTATAFLFIPLRFDLPDAAQLAPLLQRNCPR